MELHQRITKNGHTEGYLFHVYMFFHLYELGFCALITFYISMESYSSRASNGEEIIEIG
jgi:hypothetical protein